MLRTRLVTALLGLPIVLFLLVWAGRGFAALLMGVMVAGCSFEAAKMLAPQLQARFGVSEQGFKPWISGFLCACVAILFFICAVGEGQWWSGLGGIAFVLMLTVGLGSFSTRNVDLAVSQILAWVFASLYGSLPWIALWQLYLLGDHARYVMFLLAIVMLNDTGAYFVGRALGKHKLAPHYSPKKTWEGALGGIAFGIGGAFGMDAVFGFSLGPAKLLLMAAVFVGAMGIAGDLVESILKRFSKVKDSGCFFPGHGGFLDRSDSIVFAAPSLWLIMTFYKYHG